MITREEIEKLRADLNEDAQYIESYVGFVGSPDRIVRTQREAADALQQLLGEASVGAGEIGLETTALQTTPSSLRKSANDAENWSDSYDGGDEDGETYRQRGWLLDFRDQFNMAANVIDRLLASRAGGWRPTHQHYKGGLYRVVARGRIEADLSPVVIYDNDAGETWVRPVDDFDQTDPFVRFAPLPPLPEEPRT